MARGGKWWFRVENWMKSECGNQNTWACAYMYNVYAQTNRFTLLFHMIFVEQESVAIYDSYFIKSVIHERIWNWKGPNKSHYFTFYYVQCKIWPFLVINSMSWPKWYLFIIICTRVIATATMSASNPTALYSAVDETDTWVGPWHWWCWAVIVMVLYWH